jgi:uncharacterized protein YbcI
MTKRTRVLSCPSAPTQDGQEERNVAVSESGRKGEADVSILMTASKEMVRLYKELFGRGPTKARSEWVGRDALMITLEKSLTPAEQSMAEMGEHQRLRDVRLLFQHASEPRFVEMVERVTGRTVRAFISGMDTHADVASEIFYFYPEGETGPSVSERTGPR